MYHGMQSLRVQNVYSWRYQYKRMLSVIKKHNNPEPRVNNCSARFVKVEIALANLWMRPLFLYVVILRMWKGDETDADATNPKIKIPGAAKW